MEAGMASHTIIPSDSFEGIYTSHSIILSSSEPEFMIPWSDSF